MGCVVKMFTGYVIRRHIMMIHFLSSSTFLSDSASLPETPFRSSPPPLSHPLNQPVKSQKGKGSRTGQGTRQIVPYSNALHSWIPPAWICLLVCLRKSARFMFCRSASIRQLLFPGLSSWPNRLHAARIHRIPLKAAEISTRRRHQKRYRTHQSGPPCQSASLLF